MLGKDQSIVTICKVFNLLQGVSCIGRVVQKVLVRGVHSLSISIRKWPLILRPIFHQQSRN
jgi:hypothetical protein